MVPGKRSDDDEMDDDEMDESVSCGKCRRRFDYNSVPECAMGAVKCPSCGTVVDQTGSVLSEGGHKAGCTCGFCKNKGSFGKKPKDSDSGPDDGGEPAEDEFKGESKRGRLCTYCGAPCGANEFFCDKCKKEQGKGKDESLQTPEDVVDAMLEWNPKNPGTQPGILGTKSFSSTRVPSGHKDRSFTPAPGMVQPDNEIVNKQAKRKVNDGK
jgi:hypothetical protein